MINHAGRSENGKRCVAKIYLKFVSRYLAAVFVRDEYKLSRAKQKPLKTAIKRCCQCREKVETQT